LAQALFALANWAKSLKVRERGNKAIKGSAATTLVLNPEMARAQGLLRAYP
jgi:hypothetical protein